MIELKNVSKFYSTNNNVSLGLKNINLNLYENEVVAICGESGSGKSTLLNVITKMDTFDEGEIYYNGEETSYFDINDMDLFRKNKVGFIFQNYNIIESYTVLENVILPLKIRGIEAKEAKEKALSVLEKVGLKHRINNKGSELSGGEKQRTVIARALVTDSKILACDEPTGNLDSKSGKDIINLIKEVAKDKLVLIVTHNFNELKDIATRKITVYDGEIIEDLSLKNTLKEEINEPLKLDNSHLSKKSTINIAYSNLRSTPKKTIFMSLILLLVSLALLTSIVFVKDNFKDLDRESPFSTRFDQINYVINDASETLDLTSLEEKYKIEYEPTEMTNKFTIYQDDQMKKSVFTSEAIYLDPYKLDDYLVSEGRKPQNDEEIFAILPKTESNLASKMFNNILYLKGIYGYQNYKLVGYSLSKDVKSGVVLCANNKAKQFIRYGQTYSYLLFDAEITTLKTALLNIYSSDTNKIVLPTKYQELNIVGSYLYYQTYKYSKDFSILKNNFEIVYSDSMQQGIYLSDNLIIDNANEVLVYGKSKNVEKDITKLGYTSFSIKNYYTKIDFTSNLYLYLSIAGVFGLIIIVYFITYVILKICYKSKDKDYNIFRTLGITKNDMKKIVFIELESLTLLVFVVSIILVKIIVNTINNQYVLMFKNLQFSVFLIYFILIILLSYLIIRRFNKNLFKNSVSKNFKGREK